MDSIPPYEPTTLRCALSKASNFGWHLVEGNLCELADALSDEAGNRQASAPSLRIVRSRSSDDDVKVLRPLSKEEAHPRSLSAQYGYEPFPFHTDGHHTCKPRPTSCCWLPSRTMRANRPPISSGCGNRRPQPTTTI